MTFILCNAGGTLEQRLPSEHRRVQPGSKDKLRVPLEQAGRQMYATSATSR